MQLEKFLTSVKLSQFYNLVGEGKSVIIEELWESPKALLFAIASKVTQKNLIIVTSEQKETRLVEDLEFFFPGKVFEFPAWETLPSEEISPSSDIVGQRYKCLQQILKEEKPFILLTSLQAVLQRLLPKHILNSLHLFLKVGSTFSFEELPHQLAKMGYHRRPVASDKGEFALRGGIIDIFPVASSEPYRIEFFENEIDSIRIYDPISQISIKKIDEIFITPGQELELLQKQQDLSSLLDYIKDQTLIVLDDLAELEERYVNLKEISGTFSKTFSSFEDFLKDIDSLQKLFLVESSLETLSEVRFLEKQGKNELIAFNFFHKEFIANRFHHPFHTLFNAFCPPDLHSDKITGEELLLHLTHYTKELTQITFLTSSEAEKKHLMDLLGRLKVELPEETLFEQGYLSAGFFLADSKQTLIPMTEITHRYKIRRQKQRTNFNLPFSDTLVLNPGEAVVHANNGIGRFLGYEKRLNHIGVETEFLLLEYAEQAKLYVPIQQANLISKYIGVDDSQPKLHSLGSTRWKAAREKTEKAIVGYASDLLNLHAERAIKEGHIYGEDGELVKQFFEQFPYIETPDQLKAIEDIGQDMRSKKVMDRLICGDVGYGKTEVAMRAAFKAVVDGGKQVAVLVPTTVLAMQHYETFCERMQDFPLRIDILSRFRTHKQIKETLENLKQGAVDILVGTHRLLNEDVIFKNLGLVIIDEEQRFGVRAKEHLKKLKKEVDCLTLSATPIPRTLYMSLVGARDMSVINTPPQDRLPIKTMVCQYDEQLIKNALLRELSRDGQAYFIHNRVESIYLFADKLKALIPSANIVVGHGQMSAQELDQVFHAFKTGQADILVATSIIENGIDIPLANTIIVDRADRFGMGDLYQIRGRVGRWSRKAYCYFLVPNTRELPEIARKRLAALSESSGHGGGMKIAMHDLEIRGAGDILGVQQSGHVSTIGFHLYCKLLRKTINSLQKKEEPFSKTDVKIEFPIDARLPENYINEMQLRMEIYQRLGDAENNQELEHLFSEIKDRFGNPPLQVLWLYHLSRIRIFASLNQFTLLKMTQVVLEAHQSHGKKTISKKIVLGNFKNPQELENKLIEALKKNFPIKFKN